MNTNFSTKQLSRSRRAGMIAITVLLATMLSTTIGASAKSAGPDGGAPANTLYLTHNGHIVATDPAPKGANDLHYVWKQTGCRGRYAFPLVYVYFTLNGRVIGKDRAPCKANDFEFDFDAASGQISKATWTQDGKPMPIPVRLPRGANDVHVFLTGKTRLLKAYWTMDGRPIQGIDIPGYVNDMHWFGYPIPPKIDSVRTFLFFTLNGKVVGGQPSPPNANDLHYIWSNGGCNTATNTPSAKLILTVNGSPVRGLKAPCNANDFELAWSPQGCITTASWTQNGRIIATITVPAGACVNDAHIYLAGKRHLLYAWWTFNGQPILPPIRIPGRVNDMHWYGYPPPNPGVVAGVGADIYR